MANSKKNWYGEIPLMRAMILAAGQGERMRPLTEHTPKPLLQVGGKPLIVWHIENLKNAGFEDVVINIAWFGEQIPTTLGDGSKFGVNLHYSDEQQQGALETAGGIIKALPLLGTDPFLVVNGDIWCDFKFSVISPLKGNDLAHLILVDNPAHNPKGDFSLENKRVTAKVESHSNSSLTFSGIGYYHPDIFKNLSIEKHPLAPLLRSTMEKNYVSGEHFTGRWCDIGTPQRLSELDKELLST